MTSPSELGLLIVDVNVCTEWWLCCFANFRLQSLIQLCHDIQHAMTYNKSWHTTCHDIQHVMTYCIGYIKIFEGERFRRWSLTWNFSSAIVKPWVIDENFLMPQLFLVYHIEYCISIIHIPWLLFTFSNYQCPLHPGNNGIHTCNFQLLVNHLISHGCRII